MSTDNPYQAPGSEVDVIADASSDVWAFVEPKKLAAGRGWGWISEGFRLFAMSPGVWIANFLIFLVITMALAFLPFLSILNNILQPIFLGGFMRGAHTLDTENNYEVNHLFSGFKEKGGPLAIIGLLYMVGLFALVIVIMILAFIVLGASGVFNEMSEATRPEEIFLSPMFMLLILVAIFFTIPLMMAYWFAPPLVILHNLEVLQAFKMSFLGCLRNIIPFLIYGIMALLLSIVAAIPLFLGFIVLSPVLIASMYVAWKEIFTEAAA